MLSTLRINPKFAQSMILRFNIFLLLSLFAETINGYSSSLKVPSHLNSPSVIRRLTWHPTISSSSSRLWMNTYGRGAEIWPECNEDPVHLADSFPKGEVPYSAIVAIDQQDMNTLQETVENVITYHKEDIDTNNPEKGTKQQRISKRQFVSRSIKRILLRAAAKEELDSEAENGIDRTPIVVATALLLRGLVGPLDFLLVSFLTAYLTMLGIVARSPRELTGGAPILPSLPPQGHVPSMVSNPLGTGTTLSRTYDLWLKLGVLVGLVGPIALLTKYIFVQKEMVAARVCAQSIFLLCCQAISEAVSRKVMAPLPLRILIPLSYNSARLIYLWNWALNPANLGPIGRGLAIVNGVYWALNLFAFLIPVATIRYMRAHFFGVEASEVSVREGMEESVGLIPINQ